jgi:hypothetical protein
MPKNLGYTYYCAEEPTSRVPATSIALIVEPSVVLVVQMKRASLAACEAEYLEALHLDMTSDMPWKTMLVGTTKKSGWRGDVPCKRVCMGHIPHHQGQGTSMLTKAS